MESVKLKRENVKKLLQDTKGRFFEVTFVKKDGSIRRMNARLGVKKYLKGGLYSGRNHENLIPVYDMVNQGYRSVNINTVVGVNFNNTHYEVI